MNEVGADVNLTLHGLVFGRKCSHRAKPLQVRPNKTLCNHSLF